MAKITAQTNLSINQCKTLLKYNFRQFIKFGPGNYLPLSLWGHAGVGKTSLVNQAAAELAEELSVEEGRQVTIKVRYNQMSAMQPFELSGYPFIDEKSYDRPVQRYATPEFLLEASKFTYYILFFDEWNRARPEMHNAFMGYIDGRGVNGHEVPKNLFCVTAANPVTDDSTYGAVTSVEDQAILDRLIHVNVVPEESEFLTFLQLNKMADTSVLAYVTEDNAKLPNNDFKSITQSLRTTNRGLVDVAKAVGFIGNEQNFNLKMALIEAVSKGILGDTAGGAFASRYGQFEFICTSQEILDGDKTALDKIKLHVDKDDNGTAKLDQVNRVVDNLVRTLNDKSRKELTKKQIGNLNKFLDLIPHDQASKIMTKVTFKGKELEAGLKGKMVETLEVTSGVVEKPNWR